MRKNVFSARSNGRGSGVIVCGVDGSRVAREALRTAERLADGLGLAIIAAHVVAPVPVQSTQWTAAATADSDDLAAAEDLLQQVCVDAGVNDVEQQVLAGRAAERLAELADARQAELIVVGSRGHRLRQVAFIGGVASELIGLAPCPVLVVPALALDWGAAA